MAVYRVERTRDYTVMCNYHLKDKALSLKAKGLLSMMLSMPEDWNYSTRGLAAICKEGVEAVGNALKELEKAGYMVRRQLRGDNGRITDTEYIIYEKPQNTEPPAPETAPDPEGPDAPDPDTALPDSAAPDMVSPYTENPDVAEPDAENRPELNIKKSRIKKSNTFESSIHSILPSYPPAPASVTEGRNEVQEKRNEILEQIEYDMIADSNNREQVDEFVEIMLEVALAKSPTMKIGRNAEYPTALVQQRFELINSGHIEKVLDAIRENTTRIWNTRAYLLAALFNAPSTTDNHYTMLVNHDMNGG
ncbi:MAG: helix-turn-helix domain-containing protein [Oscillospiraceae bacterium]|nr:helix-turn-helix domain-containing protein [Oscillospiraceae bacterium]